MTPFFEDLIGNVTDTEAIVEVANGILTEAPKQGTVKIKIEDINDGRTCDVLLHNVLYVPGLSRRLLSVRQWNVTGGNILSLCCDST